MNTNSSNQSWAGVASAFSAFLILGVQHHHLDRTGPVLNGCGHHLAEDRRLTEKHSSLLLVLNLLKPPIALSDEKERIDDGGGWHDRKV
jgi:hypothetical protein